MSNSSIPIPDTLTPANSDTGQMDGHYESMKNNTFIKAKMDGPYESFNLITAAGMRVTTVNRYFRIMAI